MALVQACLTDLTSLPCYKKGTCYSRQTRKGIFNRDSTDQFQYNGAPGLKAFLKVNTDDDPAVTLQIEWKQTIRDLLKLAAIEGRPHSVDSDAKWNTLQEAADDSDEYYLASNEEMRANENNIPDNSLWKMLFKDRI
ncbi:uncharacterized protein [Antedon mediterranea]|uniref:uncharacterized protein isoform X2 n=1 Tax=Antedon mediterranea TaxID=105859 RepID=UPI003AF6ED8F